MCLAFLLIHLDDGILSVASDHIISDLHFTESDLGMIEAGVYLGITIGSIICPFLFEMVSPKILLVSVTLCSACCVSIWVFSTNLLALFTARVVNGIFVVSNIYT